MKKSSFIGKIKGLFSSAVHDVISVVAPRTCPLCGSVLTDAEEMLCMSCLAQAEYTGYEDILFNPMEQRLERLVGERIPAASLFIYAHGEVTGRIVSAFKYAGEKDLAVFAGRLLGQAVSQSGRFAGFDALVPIPLHPRRLKRRGYNQARELCRGMGVVWNIGVEDLLERQAYTREQAGLLRTSRLKNTQGVFRLRHGADIRGRHLVVVDDVFTTGSTVSDAVRVLLRAGAERVAVLCLCSGG